MGRGQEISVPSMPSFASSEVRYGDTVVSKTYQDPSGAIITQYLPDPAEQHQKKIAEQKINDVMGTLGKTAPELAKEFDKAAQAYTDSATRAFNASYSGALKSLREDIASRFGTLSSSEFLSGLDSLEHNRTDALAGIAEKAQTVKADLVNQEEARKLNEIQSLSGVLNDAQSNFLNTTKSALTASEALNDFMKSQWMSNLQAYTSQQNSKRQLTASLVNSAVRLIASGGGGR